MSDDLVKILREGGYDAFEVKVTPEMRQAAIDRQAAQEQALTDLSGNVPVALIEFDPLSRQRQNPWDERDDKLWLLTPDEFGMLPDGVTLVCISGETAVKGIDDIDQDTRFGMIAWGLLDSQLPPRPNHVG